jgi:glycosyltransferase involved in cell wall biosynthesis
MRILHLGWGFSPWRPGGLILFAEDLMAAQVEAGHQVSYFFSGRHYPFISGPRLKRWQRAGVAMYEVVNPRIIAGLEVGTLHPERELSEPLTESAFKRVIDEIRPDVLHIQELQGLPSSLVDVARSRGLPIVMTLHDYQPLCTTLRLYDSDGKVCMRRQIGADCVERNALAPADASDLIMQTFDYEVDRFRSLLHVSSKVDFSRVKGAVATAKGVLGRAQRTGPAEDEATDIADLSRAYQLRRDVNIERLKSIDRLLAQSHRVAEVYRILGVDTDRMSVLPSAPRDIAQLQPLVRSAPPERVVFTTLNGCASESKGSFLMRDALREMHQRGFGGRFELHVFGYVDARIRDELESNESVRVRGRYARKDLDSLLGSTHVGIIPSVWEEVLGYTGIELLAKGIPLIANPLGGIVEYAIADETAWLNASCTASGIADLMAHLIESPGDVLRMHRRVLAAREEIVHAMTARSSEIESIYGDLIQSRSVR